VILPLCQVMSQVKVLEVHDEDEDGVDDCGNVEKALNQEVVWHLSCLGVPEKKVRIVI
jgi:hypothetical protein